MTSLVDIWGCEQASGSVSWDWSWHYEWQDIWTGYRLVLRGNTFTVNIDYHIVEAPNHVPVIQVDGIVESFNCPRSGDWKIPVSVPVTVKGVTVTVPVSIGNRYVVMMTVCDPTWWSDAEYNYVSQMYKFNIYSEDYISIFGFETNFNGAFTQLVAWKDIVLKGRCRKE